MNFKTIILAGMTWVSLSLAESKPGDYPQRQKSKFL